MNVSIPTIVFGLGWKCFLNWALVFLQRRHISRSFVGCFSVSLSVMDTALTLLFATIHLHSDGPVFFLDLQLTRYHTCLLVQILGQVHSVLQWPVVVLTGLDHFCSMCLLPAASSSWGARVIRSLETVLLWFLAVLYVFLLSDFNPVLEDVSHQEIHQCWVFNASEILQVVTLLFLTLGCAALHDVCHTRLKRLKNLPLADQTTGQSRAPSRRGVVSQVLCIFLDTWAFLLIFLAVLLLLPVGIPSYLGLNVAWLCFLNSSLIAVILCVACPASRLARGLAAVPPDRFCEWRFKFSLAAEETT